VLAEPNLLASNGKEASFLPAVNIPTGSSGYPAGGSTAVSGSVQEYGVRIDFIPTITPQGTIRLQVAPKSALSTIPMKSRYRVEVPALPLASQYEVPWRTGRAL